MNAPQSNADLCIQIIEFLANALADYDKHNARTPIYFATKKLIEGLAAGHSVALSDYYGVMFGTVPSMNDDLNIIMAQFIESQGMANEQE